MIARLRLLCKRIPRVMQEDGQNLIEYALVIALIALAATTAKKTLGTRLNTAYSDIGKQVKQWAVIKKKDL
jgi:pilus assembly protein Flp/PilA